MRIAYSVLHITLLADCLLCNIMRVVSYQYKRQIV